MFTMIYIVSAMHRGRGFNCILFNDANRAWLKGMSNKKIISNYIASSERAWKNKPIGRLMLYSVSSGSEVIRKNVQNINC
jgi:hypothetical protein